MQKPRNKHDEQRAYLIINQIINILRSSDKLPEFILKKKLKGCSGICDYESITLAIFSDFFPTLIHEMIHLCHDSWNETRVIKYEKLVKRYIKMVDVIKILKLFVNLL